MADDLTYLDQPVCGLSGDDYAQVLADLLPSGLAWPRDPASVMQRTLRGLAEEWARVTERDCDLLAESYPCGATESLSDWERITGLPDPCTGPLPTLQQRRAAVCAKIAAQGGASEAYFIALAEALGFEVLEVEYFQPFRAGLSRVGERLYSEEWLYGWRVVVISPVTFVYFRAGLSAVGEPLRTWGNELLECAFEAVKPAHTVLLFAYRTESQWDDGDSIWDGGASHWDLSSSPILLDDGADAHVQD